MKNNTKSQNVSDSSRKYNTPRGIGSQSELDSAIGDQDYSADQGQSQDQNEGEGNRTAARRYNQATEQYARSGKVQPAARKAEEALDSDEGEELNQAEKQGKETGWPTY